MDASPERSRPSALEAPPSRRRIALEWGRIGCIGFGGPPAHIALLRRRVVEEHHWIASNDFEDAIAATNLLPGPASTQLAIFCAYRLGGTIGGLIGGVMFIVPGLIVIICLSAVFLAPHPPRLLLGAAAGAGSAVSAVALNAAIGLLPASWRRAAHEHARERRFVAYVLLGGLGAVFVGPYLVLVLLGCGVAEVLARGGLRHPGRAPRNLPGIVALPLFGVALATGSLGLLAFEAFKVGALSYGGGFVIIPLMSNDVVHHFRWMTATQFLNAVALGQVTPGPVVQTIAVVGYAVDRVRGALLGALVAFTPSFVFVLGGGRHFDRLRASTAVQQFLGGAAPAAIGTIAGAAIPLGLDLRHLWQLGVLGAAVVYLVALRRNVVVGLLAAGGIGAIAAALGAPVRRRRAPSERRLRSPSRRGRRTPSASPRGSCR